jgi:hypothetical protein
MTKSIFVVGLLAFPGQLSAQASDCSPILVARYQGAPRDVSAVLEQAETWLTDWSDKTLRLNSAGDKLQVSDGQFFHNQCTNDFLLRTKYTEMVLGKVKTQSAEPRAAENGGPSLKGFVKDLLPEVLGHLLIKLLFKH